MTSDEDAHDLAGLALSETADAIKVLSEGALAKNIEPGINLIAAGVLLQVAQHTPHFAIDTMFQQAISRLRAARTDLADPATLPASYGN
jgi:hypothetical protein